MALIDEIERLGQLSKTGEISKDKATQLLVEYSKGGLTHLGALDSIQNWRTCRPKYKDIFDSTQRSLTKLKKQMVISH
ncbi:hypothetical protein MK805_13370 [Shimazuella sp. AN120528]|uniref:hypothetical protein n=1 Tax=Shimazuella soli TaxID=1892854 RepID=UPI001F0FC9C6|nr:hypothetical protein [Shimazuella soli]MCH5585931.1 hypothetical protein [Shimazuella soli]